MRAATVNILADFLKEIKEVTQVRKRMEEHDKGRQNSGSIVQHGEDYGGQLDQGAFMESPTTTVQFEAGSSKEEPEHEEEDLGGKKFRPYRCVVRVWNSFRSIYIRYGRPD